MERALSKKSFLYNYEVNLMPVFSGKLNVVLVMQRSRVTHIRQGLLMFSFPMPEWPMMPFQTVWSEITLALKLPSQIILLDLVMLPTKVVFTSLEILTLWSEGWS